VPIRVLLADDNEPVRKAICRVLNGDDEIELVAEATTFTQTMNFAATLRPHVIVMDLHMRDEAEVTPLQLKSSIGGSRLLAISIWNDAAAKTLADSFGAVTLLDKVNLAVELIPAIKRCASNRQQTSSRGGNVLGII
jgi:DNA-binding NarL/FixJ family response regulator